MLTMFLLEKNHSQKKPVKVATKRPHPRNFTYRIIWTQRSAILWKIVSGTFSGRPHWIGHSPQPRHFRTHRKNTTRLFTNHFGGRQFGIRKWDRCGRNVSRLAHVSSTFVSAVQSQLKFKVWGCIRTVQYSTLTIRNRWLLQQWRRSNILWIYYIYSDFISLCSIIIYYFF